MYPLQALGSFPINLPLAHWMSLVTACFIGGPACVSLVWSFWKYRVIPKKMQPEIPETVEYRRAA